MLERVASRLHRRGCILQCFQSRKRPVSSLSKTLHSAFWMRSGKAILGVILGGETIGRANTEKCGYGIKQTASRVTKRLSTYIREWLVSMHVEHASKQLPNRQYLLSASTPDFLHSPKALTLLQGLSNTERVCTAKRKLPFVSYSYLRSRSYASFIPDSAAARRAARAQEEAALAAATAAAAQTVTIDDTEQRPTGPAISFARSGADPNVTYLRRHGTSDWVTPQVITLESLNPKDFDQSEESFERAWKWYHQTDDAPTQPALNLETSSTRLGFLLGYLAQSGREIDAERTIEIVRTTEPNTRFANETRYLVQAALKLKKSELALIALKQNASSSTRSIHAGFEGFLAYCINGQMWDRALLAWTLLLKYHDGAPRFQDVSARYVVDSINEFGNKFVDWISTLVGDQPVSRDFATFLSKGCYDSYGRKSPVKHISERELQIVINIMEAKGWYMRDFARFENEILGASYRSNHAKVIETYLQYRIHSAANPSNLLLERVLIATIELDDYITMQMVFEDWFRFQGQPTRAAYRLIMRDFAWQGEISILDDLFKNYEARFPVDVKDITCLLRARVQRGKIRDALQKFQELASYDLEPDLKCFNVLLEGLARSYDIESAMELLQVILDAGFQPNAKTYTSMMYVCAARGDVENTEALFRAANTAMIKPTQAMWNMIVWAHVKTGAVGLASKILQFIEGLGLNLSMTSMYNMVMDGYAKRIHKQQINHTFVHMKEKNIPFDYHTYSIMVDSLCRFGKFEKARRMLDLLYSQGIKGNAVPYTTLMSAYIRKRKYQDVIAVYKLMLAHKVRPDFATQSLLLMASVKEAKSFSAITGKPDFSSAEEIADAAIANFAGHDPTSFSSVKTVVPSNLFTPLISEYLQVEDYEAVVRTYEKFMDLQTDVDRAKPDMAMLLKMIQAHQRARNWGGVRELWKTIYSQAQQESRPFAEIKTQKKVTKIKYRSLSPALDIFIEAAIESIGMHDEEKITVSEVNEIISDITVWGFQLDGGNWNALVVLLAQAGDLLQAFQIAQEKLVRKHGQTKQNMVRTDHYLYLGERPSMYPHTKTVLSLAEQLKFAFEKTRLDDADAALSARKLVETIRSTCVDMFLICNSRIKRRMVATSEEVHAKLMEFREFALRQQQGPFVVNIYDHPEFKNKHPRIKGVGGGTNDLVSPTDGELEMPFDPEEDDE